MGESAIDEAIAPIYTAYANVQTSILFSKVEVEVHLAATSADEGNALTTLDDLSRKIADKLGIAVFATNGETMEQVIAKLLTDRGETVSTAESCTGGLIARRLTELAGLIEILYGRRRDLFERGKDADARRETRDVDKFGAVSSETAEAMAAGHARAGRHRLCDLGHRYRGAGRRL